LASKLPESNNAMILTCYNCGQNGHIKPNCPKLNDGHRTSNVTPNTTPEATPPPPAPNVNPPATPKAVVEKNDGERVRIPMAAWKRIRPFDIIVAHIDNDGKEWKLCTKCTDKHSGKQRLFNLIHFNVDHKDGFRHPTLAANLTMLGDPLDNVPVGPPLATTVETNEEMDPNELTFTGAWCCPLDNAPRGKTTVTRLPKLNDSRDIRDIGPPMTALSQRHCDDTSSDEDSLTDESKCGHYYEWEQDWDDNEDNMDETQNDNVKITVSASLIQFIQMLIVTAQTVLLTFLTFGSVGTQWGVQTARSATSTSVIEPLWRTCVLPIFWANTLFWDGSRWVTTPDNYGHNKVSSSVSHRVTRMSRKRDRKRLTHLPLYTYLPQPGSSLKVLFVCFQQPIMVANPLTLSPR
jgi:hypothetical protein